MPIWLQLVIPVAAGLVSWLMGIALVPYLQKLRFFPPELPKDTESREAAGEERRPIMGGLLLLAGLVFAGVLGVTLLMQFGGMDRTSPAFSEQLDLLCGTGITAGLWCVIGIVSDVLMIRGRYNPNLWNYILLPLVLMAVACPMEYLFHGNPHQWWIWLIPPVVGTFCFVWECDLEHDTDGALITVNAVELLALTMLLLRQSQKLPAVFTLAAAGACMGTMVWCLHPARCRLGRTGEYLIAGIVPLICLWYGMYRELALMMAVFVLQQLYRLWKHENKYLTEGMAEAGIQPLARIAILAGIAVFCGLMALLLK